MTVYAGKYLRVDLSKGDWREESISEAEVKHWLLGSGFITMKWMPHSTRWIRPVRC